MNKLLDLCKKLWISILIILAVIVIIIEFYTIFWLIDFDGINNTIKIFSNIILAACAVIALTNWKKELKSKREYETIDSLLKLIIKRQNMLSAKFCRVLLGLNDTNGETLNVQVIQSNVIDIGNEFEFISLKCKTFNNTLLEEKALALSKLFKEFVDVQMERNETFYELYLHNYNNFKTNVDKMLLETKQDCIK